jgi:hypothetical protein
MERSGNAAPTPILRERPEEGYAAPDVASFEVFDLLVMVVHPRRWKERDG